MRLRAGLVLVTALAGAGLATAGPAGAYWRASGAGSGTAPVDTINAAVLSVPATSAASVTVTGTTAATFAVSTGQNSGISYKFERRLGTGGTWTAIAAGACSGTFAAFPSSCADTVPATGSYYYRTVATYHTWTATSAAAGPVAADLDAPTVTVNQAAGQADPAASTPVHFTATFSEAVTGFTSSDVTLGGTADHTGATVTLSQTDATHYDIVVDALVTDGTLTASLPAGAVADAVANTSAASTSTDNTVTVNAILDAPTSVALTNGGGTGNAYVDNANKAGVNVDVTLDSSSQSGDTVALKASDGVAAHDVTASHAATAGAGTVSFTGLDLSGLSDGSITLTATTSDAVGHTPQTRSATVAKDVVAPAAPTAAAFANGLSATGSGAYISTNNQTATQWTVTRSGATSDIVAVTLTSGATTASGSATAGSAGNPATVTVDASALAEGSVTRTATATDLAGNVSSTYAPGGTIATKDTTRPSAPSTNTLLYVYGRNSGSTPDTVSGLTGAITTSGDYAQMVETTPHSGTSFAYVSPVAGALGTFGATNVDAIASGSVTYVIYELDPAGNQSATGTTFTQASG